MFKNLISTFQAVFCLVVLCSCPFNQTEPGEYNPRYGDFRNRSGSDSIEAKILSGHDPAEALDDLMLGPTTHCQNGYYESDGTQRPLKGRALVEYLDKNYPKNCRYKFRGWTNSDSRKYKPNIRAVAEGKIPNCHPSNCSTATYLALIEAMKGTPHLERLKGDIHFGGKLYHSFVIQPNGVERTFKDFGLGPTKRISPMSTRVITQAQKEGWPKSGDIMLLNRKNGSGHATVFSHFQGSGRGAKVCYWSSNKGTNGMGIQCERLSRMSRIDLGRVE